MGMVVRRSGRRLRAADALALTGSSSQSLAHELLRQIIEALGLPERLSRRERREHE